MLDPFFQKWVDRVDTRLIDYFSKKNAATHPLERSMEYSLLAGGKRMRPLLTLAVIQDFGLDPEPALDICLASELLHTYSLIHDDLPCMDDDELRRGKPTNHIVFGEALAILSGDALHTESFDILLKAPYPGLTPEKRLLILQDFVEAVGKSGMVGGQVMDMQQSGKGISREQLTELHTCKTGALIKFCVLLGGRLANMDSGQERQLRSFAAQLGLLFQVVDDLLDQESDSATLGKTAGKDLDQDKSTFPKLIGLEETKNFADQLVQGCVQSLNSLGRPCNLLHNLTEYFRSRGH